MINIKFHKKEYFLKKNLGLHFGLLRFFRSHFPALLCTRPKYNKTAYNQALMTTALLHTYLVCGSPSSFKLRGVFKASFRGCRFGPL